MVSRLSRAADVLAGLTVLGHWWGPVGLAYGLLGCWFGAMCWYARRMA